MRIGIFSDIHSNLEALQVVLDFFLEQKVEQYLFIGDLVGYGANPNECIELVKKLKCENVAGNHDFGVLEKTDISRFNDAAQKAVLWTKQELTKESKAFLEQLILMNKTKNMLLIHSTPSCPCEWEYIITLKQAQEQFGFFTQKICFIGHSHYPIVFEYSKKNNKTIIINDKKCTIKGSDYQYLINVGSIGQPRDGDSRSCAVILDTKKNYLKFERLQYNIQLTQEKIIKAGLPEILASRLAIGK